MKITNWLGYLEHASLNNLELFDANVGKGGYTIFSELLYKKTGVNFQGIPWCTIFVYAVHPYATYLRIGSPCSGVLTLMRNAAIRFRLRGKKYMPKNGDLIICRNASSQFPDHVGIVLQCTDDEILSIDGNTIDPTGHFKPNDGGCVALRKRQNGDSRIVGFIKMGVYGRDIT